MPTSGCISVSGPRLEARLRAGGFTELFAEVWPAVAARLERSLSRRGVDRLSREDIVQDVAVRALVNRVSFGSAEDLVGWALTVGHNLWTDEGRRWVRRGGACLPLLDNEDDDNGCIGIASGVDPAGLVEDRLALQAVVEALRSMSAADRESIVRLMEGVHSRGRAETNRWGQRRSRVRQRLRAVVDGAAAAIVLVRVRLRSTGHRVVEPAMGLVTLGFVPLMAGILMVSGFGGGSPEAKRSSTPSSGRVVDVSSRAPAGPGHDPEPVAPRSLPDVPRPLEPVDAYTKSVELLVPSPVDGAPLVDGEVREEDGDDPLVCVTNLPVLGSHCAVTGDGLVLP